MSQKSYRGAFLPIILIRNEFSHDTRILKTSAFLLNKEINKISLELRDFKYILLIDQEDNK